MHLDVAIFGGGVAGLWLLDELSQTGSRVLLLEAGRLGAGQTVTSQGILHGGVKYTLGGLLTASARAIREMPTLWRRCLAGEQRPDLSRTRLRAEFCYLWQTKSLSSRMGMIGARAGLHVAPTALAPDARPDVLRRCPGCVARIDEQVIEPDSFAADLRRQHKESLLRIDADSGLEFDTGGPGEIRLIRLINPDTGGPLDLAPACTVFTAGEGNEVLRRRAGLAGAAMQRRPLHMVVARGELPTLNGHCVDGMRTRATITTTTDYDERTIWQIGGQIAEDGVKMDRKDLVRHAKSEIVAILPGIDLADVEWATYSVDRAEAATTSGLRPGDARVRREGDTITGWPTKLVLAPQLAQQVRALLPEPESRQPMELDRIADWPRPEIALPPWEEDLQWSIVD